MGTGPDTFALVFPQNDVVSMLRYIGTTEALVTKAHNTYLNHAVNLGILGLVAFAALQLSAVKELLSETGRQWRHLDSRALLLGLVLFALMGLANDSRVFIAVYHWLFIGLAASAGGQSEVQEGG